MRGITSRTHRLFILMMLALSIASADQALAGDVKVGGWAGFAFMDNDKAGSIPAFDAHPWYMYVSAEPVDGWRFFGELEAEHVFQFEAGKTGAGQFQLERLYIERNLRAHHNFRAGKTFLPFGYWYNLHWHFLTETLSRPTSFNNAYVPRQNVGVQYFGRHYAADTRVDYYAWIGNGPDVFGTNNRTVDAFSRGASVYVLRPLGSSPKRSLGLTAGYHAQSASNGTETDDQTHTVVAAEIKFERLELRAESYRHERSTRDDLRTWYANGTFWAEERVALNIRVENGDDLKGAVNDDIPGVSVVSYGVMFRPEANILVKGEYRTSDFDDPGTADYADWNTYLALKY